MRKSFPRIFLLAALLGAAAVSPVFGSGSYPGRPPRPPAGDRGDMSLDREKYGLGQKIYAGKAKLMDSGDAMAQKPRLQTAQAQLPAGNGVDLVGLAGRLSPGQLDALEYFVKQRFAVKK